MEIIPAILSQTEADLKEKVAQAEPYFERFHLDVADGIFVANTTIGADEISRLDTPMKISVHLMVSKPENHIVRWLETMADTFIFHAEATAKAQEFITATREKDCSVGVALNPKTPITIVEDYIDSIDFVQFMTVEPGFYGSPFVEAVVQKIQDFHYFYPDKPIVVDGAINPERLHMLSEVGVSIAVVGSYIFKSKDIAKSLDELRQNI